jgi:hypothetical protein
MKLGGNCPTGCKFCPRCIHHVCPCCTASTLPACAPVAATAVTFAWRITKAAELWFRYDKSSVHLINNQLDGPGVFFEEFIKKQLVKEFRLLLERRGLHTSLQEHTIGAYPQPRWNHFKPSNYSSIQHFISTHIPLRVKAKLYLNLIKHYAMNTHEGWKYSSTHT